MNFEIKGINHITFSVSNLEKSCEFYEKVFNIKPEYKWETGVYYNLCGYWLALNEEKNIPRKEIKYSYTHIAFSIDEDKMNLAKDHLEKLKINYTLGRKRDRKEKNSIYFEDPDGHKFELHCGTMKDRVDYYNEICK